MALHLLALLSGAVAVGKVDPALVLGTLGALVDPALPRSLTAGLEGPLRLPGPASERLMAPSAPELPSPETGALTLPGLGLPSALPRGRKPPVGGVDPKIVLRVFRHWQIATGRPTARLTPDRASAMRGRLREGYSEEELLAAIDGCASSPFHTGENQSQKRYDDITLICRSGSKLEGFIEAAGGVAPPLTSQRTDEDKKTERHTELRAQAREAQERGDREGYERANAELRRLGA